jgi:hypothetical protein
LRLLAMAIVQQTLLTLVLRLKSPTFRFLAAL